MWGEALVAAANETYGEGITGMLSVGALGPAPVLCRLAEVSFRDPVRHGDAVLLKARWEVIGTGGSLSPALDTDITMTPAGEDSAHL